MLTYLEKCIFWGDLLFSINSKSMSCEFMYSFNKQKAPSIFLQTKCYGTLIFNNRSAQKFMTSELCGGIYQRAETLNQFRIQPSHCIWMSALPLQSCLPFACFLATKMKTAVLLTWSVTFCRSISQAPTRHLVKYEMKNPKTNHMSA